MFKQSVGRPLKFQSVDELQKKIDEYFKSCFDYSRDMFGNRIVDKDATKENNGKKVYIMKQIKPYTITGLAVYLDTCRDVLLDYESGKYDDPERDILLNEQFSDTIKKAKAVIYAYAEESLFNGRQATGPIFNLKNNWGWQDKQIIEDNRDPNRLTEEAERQIDEKLNRLVENSESNTNSQS